MRNWLGGVTLTAVTACGVFFVMSRTGNPSHCGPCVSGKCSVPIPLNADSPAVSLPSSDVFDVVDVRQTPPELPNEPRRLPFINFDEPPLANPVRTSGVDDGIIQAGFVAPATIPLADDTLPASIETAPLPRLTPAAGFPLRSEKDKF